MSDESNPKNAGRPRHPKWDEMHDLDRYLKLVDITAQNIVTGKWKKTPSGMESALERMREILINKYPEYFKTVEQRVVAAELVANDEELAPLVTPEPKKEEPKFSFPQGTLERK